MRQHILLFIPLLASAQVQKITLEEAVALALKSNPQVDAARLNALATSEDVIQTRAAYYPYVSGQFSGVGAPNDTRLGAGQLSNSLILSRVGMGFAVNQLLTDFGRTSKLVESAGFRTRADQQAARATRAQIVLQVQQAYLAALRAQAIAKVADQTVATRQTILDQVSAMAENKLKSELDVRFAEVSLTEAKLLLTTVTNERQAAGADLAAAMGLRAPQYFELVKPAGRATSLQEPGQLIEEAIRQNPEAEQRRYILEAAIRQADAERRLKYPSVTALASAGVVPIHARDFVRDTYVAGGVNVSVPLFTGKLIASRRAEAELRSESARRTLQEAENRIARNVSVTLLNIRTASERVALASGLVDQSRQALELAQLRYDLGLSSIVELTQSQLALINAEIQLATGRYDVELQRAILSFHAGATP